MKKIIFAVLALAFSGSALAESVPNNARGLMLRDTKTNEMRMVSEAETISATSMKSFVAPAQGSEEVYDAYVKSGYLPLHAMMLTNWDVSEGLRLALPGLPEDLSLKVKINDLRQEYRPAS